ncbi:YitT family protein [Chlamydiales bacterium]|nr:YitT family protein [Chlamydiales bacterium]
MAKNNTPTYPLSTQIMFFFWTLVGAFLAAFAIDVFFIPNRLIDGGTVGLAMILSKLYGNKALPLFLLLLNMPFLYIGWRSVGKTFLAHLAFSNIVFIISLFIIQQYIPFKFYGETIEVVAIGGVILGIGLGLIIRMGGCLDGTEILGIIAHKKTGMTVGQVVLGCNILVFAFAGFAFQDWHPPLLSFITFVIASRVMDAVIVGFDETKSVLVVSQKFQEVSQSIMHEMGLGLTIMYGRGGFSGEEKEIIYVICERLQLADLKALIFREDPQAFVAIENLHEVSNGNQNPGFLGPGPKPHKLMKYFYRKKH